MMPASLHGLNGGLCIIGNLLMIGKRQLRRLLLIALLCNLFIVIVEHYRQCPACNPVIGLKAEAAVLIRITADNARLLSLQATEAPVPAVYIITSLKDTVVGGKVRSAHPGKDRHQHGAGQRAVRRKRLYRRSL